MCVVAVPWLCRRGTAARYDVARTLLRIARPTTRGVTGGTPQLEVARPVSEWLSK